MINLLRITTTVTGNGFKPETFFSGRGIYEIIENINSISLVIFLPVNRIGELRMDYKRNGKFFGSELDDNWGTLTSGCNSIERKRIINYNFQGLTLTDVFNRIAEEEKVFSKYEEEKPCEESSLVDLTQYIEDTQPLSI